MMLSVPAISNRIATKIARPRPFILCFLSVRRRPCDESRRCRLTSSHSGPPILLLQARLGSGPRSEFALSVPSCRGRERPAGRGGALARPLRSIGTKRHDKGQAAAAGLIKVLAAARLLSEVQLVT